MQDDLLTNNIIKTKKESTNILKMTTLLFAILSICLSILLMILIPLKRDVPYVIRIDDNSYLNQVTRLDDIKSISADQAIREALLRQYIVNRESYNYYTIEKQANTVLEQTSEDNQLKSNYFSLFQGEDNIINIYKDNINITVNIDNVTPLRNKILNDKYKVYSYDLIIQKSYFKSGKKTPYKEQKYRVIIGFYFDTDLTLTERSRLYNPLGMQVVEYRTSIISEKNNDNEHE